MSSEKNAQLIIRNLRRYKKQNGTHADLVTDDLLSKLNKFADEENFPPGPEEKHTTYPLEWASSKRGVTTAIGKFEKYAASKEEAEEEKEEEEEEAKKKKEKEAEKKEKEKEAEKKEKEKEEAKKKKEKEAEKKEKEKEEAKKKKEKEAEKKEKEKEAEKKEKEKEAEKKEKEKEAEKKKKEKEAEKEKEEAEKRAKAKVKIEEGEASDGEGDEASDGEGGEASDGEGGEASDGVSLVDPAVWPNFSRIVGKEISLPTWKALAKECEYSGCDFIDVGFRLEIHCQGDDGETTPAGLLRFAYTWLQACPEAMRDMEKDFYGNQDLKKTFDEYRKSHPRPVLRHASPKLESRWGSPARTREQSVFSENPQRDREEVGFASTEATPGWDRITLSHDPDADGDIPDRQPVEGTIHLIIWRYLDVCLPSLEDPDKERHVLIPCADYPDEADRFSKTEEGKKKIIRKGADRKSLNGCRREDITILYYVSAVQVYEDTYPQTYAVGFKSIQPEQGIMPWTRGIFAGKFNKGGMIDAEINQLREEVGQKPITITPKYIG
ncbi:hypothetical protein GGR55DRAFT_684667 [Xylaria sp. FL0064]|nr:hypothetical protein GGR55DRAFT_684667 [Xylaria sp. FL0064]